MAAVSALRPTAFDDLHEAYGVEWTHGQGLTSYGQLPADLLALHIPS